MLVSGQNVQCGEDALTGEPDDIDKHPLTRENYDSKSCIMFAKASVANGVGAALVLAVGENTAAGAITKKT
jgi:magnesium-transporting ATPase (P-type)